jgi:hypothetical protein
MLRRLGLKALLSLVGREIRGVAEGKRGAGPQRIYQALQGRKRIVGILLACLCVALAQAGAALGEPGLVTAGAGIGLIAGVLVSAGLVDADWRSAVPSDSRVYRLLRDHSADVALLLGGLAAALQACDAETAALLLRAHLTCGQAQAILGAVAAVLVQLGLQSEARLAEPPRVDR